MDDELREAVKVLKENGYPSSAKEHVLVSKRLRILVDFVDNYLALTKEEGVPTEDEVCDWYLSQNVYFKGNGNATQWARAILNYFLPLLLKSRKECEELRRMLFNYAGTEDGIKNLNQEIKQLQSTLAEKDKEIEMLQQTPYNAELEIKLKEKDQRIAELEEKLNIKYSSPKQMEFKNKLEHSQAKVSDNEVKKWKPYMLKKDKKEKK